MTLCVFVVGETLFPPSGVGQNFKQTRPEIEIFKRNAFNAPFVPLLENDSNLSNFYKQLPFWEASAEWMRGTLSLEPSQTPTDRNRAGVQFSDGDPLLERVQLLLSIPLWAKQPLAFASWWFTSISLQQLILETIIHLPGPLDIYPNLAKQPCHPLALIWLEEILKIEKHGVILGRAGEKAYFYQK